MNQNNPPSPVIDQFVSQYRKVFDFYEQSARIVAQQIESKLESSGIRAIVTSRAKNPKRLETKIRQRDAKIVYASVEAIYADIVDLAGVRVALYFPAERDETDRIIRENFKFLEMPKVFTGASNPTMQKRFSGYWATHYRLFLREDTLAGQDVRFADARVEVQVASVLMHAWSEVEHDLIYKPMQGKLSEDELAILDELNGMVLVGEIALERLQRAAKMRLSAAGSSFENHYDLAAFLLELGRARINEAGKEPVVGDVETLFRLLVSLKISAAEQLQPYLQSLTPDNDNVPLAQQIIDQIVAADPLRYATYASIRSEQSITDVADGVHNISQSADSFQADFGYFMAHWVTFERVLRNLSVRRNLDQILATTVSKNLLKKIDIFSDEEIEKIDSIRMIRNELLHRRTIGTQVMLRREGDTLADIVRSLAQSEDVEIASAAQQALLENREMEALYRNIILVEPKSHSLKVSHDALTLLIAAAEDKNGQILRLSFLSGRIIQAGKKQFGENSPREASRWDAALNELVSEKLVEVRGHKGEVFELTHAGWVLADNGA
jgi:ppGpp synthetase/RelA/SpoT-type nucleotidyltranferase